MTSLGVFVLAATLVVGSIAAPFRDDLVYNGQDAYVAVADSQADQDTEDIQQCATSCPADTKFQYMTGQTYEYQYDADIKTSIPGSTEHSSLHIRARASVDVLSTCEMVLRLSDVSLQDSDPSKYENRQYVDNSRQFQQSLEKNAVRFAFIDGTIENICPVTAEESWVLNIKRGILSTFQTTMETLQGVSETTETDVSGNCPVKYEASSRWGTLKVKKTKNLLGCTERASVQTVFQSVGYEADSDYQTMPLMKGTHECNQEVNSKSKTLTKSECTESHVFRPFSRQDSGAATEIKYKLVFVKQSEGTQRDSGSMQSRVSLLYDHSMSDAEMSTTLREAQETVTQLCRQTKTDVRPNAPALFATLVKQMRVLDARNLRQLLAATKQGICGKAEQFFRDALPVLGTTESVSMIRELVTRKQTSGPEAEELLTSIAFIKKPTKEMMKELQGLLSADLDRTALPISSVVNTYCKLNSAESSEVQAIVKIFEDELKYNCRVEGDNPSRILLALRALGNAGNAERVTPTLSRCAMNEDAPMAVRIAAIAAFRRISCSASREEVFKILENRQADSELRINAYLAVMQCADKAVIKRVRQLLETEEVNQVGSFMWTHLTNLAETSCPMKSDINDIIEDAHLLKNFDIDKRKFSRNLEFSAYSELFNVGGTVDSNVIFSSASYVPRSMNLNLTANLFGRSMNLFEVGGRAQGMEALLERYFGPGKEFEAAMKRDKRAVIRDDVINNIDRKFPKTRDNTQLSYYLRVFGNEIRSGDIYNIDVDAAKDRFNVLDLLVQMAQDRSVDFTRNFAFLDTNIVVPTGVGMPLSLGVEGTVTVALKANGKIDIRKMLSSPSNFDVTGSVRPSTALEIQGEFGVDAHVTRTRLRMTNTLHTSTLLDGKLTLKDGQVFNADWNMPQQKMEIFSAESHFYISHRGQDREQTSKSPKSTESKRCTDPAWSNKLGLELCGEISYPSSASGGAMFPLSGPAVAKVYINKLDTFTAAKFEASVIRSQSDKTDTARFSFTTPGSQVDRELTADFKLDRANKDLSFNLKSPWKKVAITGQVVDQPALKKTVLKAMLDDRVEYSITAELAIAEQRGAEIKYTPNVRIVVPGREPITLDGELTYTKGKNVQGKVAIRNALSEPITAEGSVELQDKRKSQKYDANVQFFSPTLSGSFTGYVSSIQDNGNAWAMRGDVNYQYKNEAKQRIVMNHKIRDTSTANLKTYNIDGSWTSTMWPQYNGNYLIEEQYSPTSLRTMLEAGFDSQRKITIVQSGAFDVTGVDKKFNGMLKFELPYKNWNYEAKLDHIHNWDLLQSNASLKYDGNKEHTIDIGVRKENTKHLSVLAEAKFKMAGKSPITLTNVLKENTPREYHNTLNVAAHGRTVRAISLYKMGQRHDLSTEVHATGLDPITFKGHFHPNLRNMQARAEVKYGQSEYMADVNWLHRGTAAGFNIRAGAEILYLNRNYGISGEVSRLNQNFSATMEAKLGQTQKVSLSGQFTAIPTAPKAEVRVEWPGNYIAVNGAAKFETQGWYHTKNDLEASLKVTTSLKGLEEIGGSVKVDISQDALKSSVEVMWAPDRKVTGDFGYDKTKATLNLATPFQGYRTIMAETTYQVKGRTVTINTRLQWENNQISLAGTTTSQRGNGYSLTSNGEFTLTTPWREYSRTKLSWRHQNDDGTMWNCRHELELEGGRKYVLDVVGTRKLVPGRSYAINLKSTLTTPIQNWEQVGFTWETSNEYRSIKSQGKGTVTWGRNTIHLEHDLNIQPYSTFVAKAVVTTTFPGYEIMGVNMDNKLNTMNNVYSLTNEVMYGDPRSKVNLDGTLSVNGPTINAGLRLTTPHPKYPRMVANFRNARQEDGAWALHGDLEYAPDRSFTLDSKLSMDRTYGFELSMTSPLENLRKMNAKAVATIRSPKSFGVTAEVSHNLLRDKLQFETAVEVETISAARISISLQTPFREIRSAKASISHKYESKEKCVTSTNYEFNDYRGDLNHEQTIRSPFEFDGKTRVVYLGGKIITFDHRVSLNSRRSIITASLNTPFPEVRSLEVSVNVDGHKDNFKATGEVVYNRRDKIDIGLDHTLVPDNDIIKSSLRITTPFEKLRRFVFSIDRLGSDFDEKKGPNWKELSEITVELNDKRWYGKSDIQSKNGVKKINVKTELPYESFRKFEFNVEFTPRSGKDGNGFSTSAWYEVNGKRYNGESEYIWVGKQLKAKVMVMAPEEYSVVLSHKADSNETTTVLTAKAGPHGSGTASFKMDKAGSLDARASVETPYRGYEKFNATLKHEGPVSNFKTTVNLSTPFRDYRNFTAVLTYRGNPNDFTSSLQVDTPFHSMERLKVSANHRMSGSNGLDSGASVEYNNKKIAATLTYKNDNRTVKVSTHVVTPFKGYETMSVEVNHTGDTWQTFHTNGRLTTSLRDLREVTFTLDTSIANISDVKVRAELGLPAGKLSGAYTHSSRGAGDVQCRLEVSTPYKGYEKFSAAVDRQSGNGNPHTKVTVTTTIRGYENFVLTTEKTGTLSNLSLKAELTTSVVSLTHAAVTWTHALTQDNFDFNGKVETSYPGHEKLAITYSHSTTKSGFKSLASAETSIQGYERFAYNLDVTTNRQRQIVMNVKSTIAVETSIRNYEKFGGSLEYSVVGEGFKASATVNTPIQGYKNFGASINHAGTIAQFETTGSITTPFRSVPQIDYTLRHRGNTLHDFSTFAGIVYNGDKKVDVELTYIARTPSRYEAYYEGSFKFNCQPSPYFKGVSLTVLHSRKPTMNTGGMKVTFNGEKKLDFDYSYATRGDDSNIVITMRDPYPMATNLNMADTATSAAVNWDTSDPNKKVRFDFALKNVQTSSSTERLLSIKTLLPKRIVGFSFGYNLTPEKFTNKGELYWTASNLPDFTYEIQGTKSESLSLQAYGGSFKIASSQVNFESSVSHKSQPGRKYVTEIGLQTTNKLSIKNDITFTGERDFTQTLTVTHPRLIRDISLITETKNGNSFTSTLTFNRQSATLQGRLSDESRSGHSIRYTGSVRLSHPNSFTDVQLSGEAYAEAEKLGGSLKSQYQTSRDRQMQTAELRAEINRIRGELTAELTSPLDVLKISAVNRQLTEEPGVYRYDITASTGQASCRATMDFNAKDRSGDIKLYTGQDDYIEIFAQTFSPTQASFELSRVSKGQKISDASASISLSDDCMLTGKAYLRPELVRDIQGYYQGVAKNPPMLREFGAAVERLRRAAQDDMQLKGRYFSDAAQPIQEAINAFGDEFKNVINEIQKAFDNAYRHNEFYMRDIHQALKRHYEDLSRRVQYKMVELRRSWDNIVERIQQTNAFAVIAQRFKECCQWIELQTREVRNEMMERARNVKQHFDNVSNNVAMKHRENMENLYRQPWFQRMSPAQFTEFIRVNYEQFMGRVQATLDETANRPELTKFRDALLRYIQENPWMYQSLGLEPQMKAFVQQARNMNWPTMKAMAKQSMGQFFRVDKNRWTVWDPQRGEFAFEAYMPVDLPDLTMLQRLPKFVSYSNDVLSRYLPDEDWNLMDTIYKYKPKSDVADWVPPFKAHASIAGSQHFMTFDKKFFDFAGECSYLLARDFIDKTFSVVVNYDKAVRGQPTKKSITVICEGKQIEIYSDAKITLDGSRVEMPLRVGNATVSRQGSAINVKNDLGLDVTCDLPHDHCTVAVSGWYYGKTGGLFGTYDNEPSNDFTTIDKTVVERPEMMADGWSVGTRCRPVNKAITSPMDENTRRYRTCAKYFSDPSSPFRSCFRSVDPKPFLSMCVNDVSTNDNSLEAQEDVCRVAAAYQHECRRQEVHIRMPSQCVRCEVPFSSDKFYEGETKKLSAGDVPKTADVVFLVHHAACNKDMVDKLKGVVDDMEKALRVEGLKNNHYAVVGFGGQGHLNEPQVRTMDGQIFNSANKVAATLNGFSSESGSSPDTMSALGYAARLPFRAGASKTIILIPCDSCKEHTMRYSDVQRVLIQSDIRLHVLVQEPILLKSRSPKTAFIFGVDENTVYTSKDTSDELAGDEDLRKYIRMPKDLCVALTQDTFGAVFSARQWLDSRAVTQKKFSDIMVRAIARKAAPSECQMCECVADQNGNGVSQCQSCTPRHPIYSMKPNFYGDDFSDNEVAEVAKPVEQVPEIDAGETWVTASPRTTARPKKGDRVTRKPKPTKGPKKVPPPKQPVPVKPKVMDQ